MKEARKIVFFDGGCVLCSRVVAWTHRRDRAQEIWFASLDSAFAAQHRVALALPEAGQGAETFAFWVREDGVRENEERENGVVSFKSEGALLLLNHLGGFWAALAGLGALLPLGARDGLYDLIARNRRKWFATSEGCLLPPASLRGKVLA